MVQREMEKLGLGEKVECTQEQIGSIFRLRANPEGERQGGIVPPPLRSWPLGRRSDRRPARLACCFPPLPCHIQLAVPLVEDRPVATGQLVRGGDVADRTVQADLVVMGYELRDEPPR